jgi:hypothetical protein
LKKNVNYVEQSALLSIASELGLETKEQAGFIRLQAPGKPDYRLYVAKTKTVGRVDISGFTPAEQTGIRLLGGESFGKVKAQLDFTAAPAWLILSAFRSTCLEMISLPAPTKEEVVKAKKERSVRASGGVVKEASVRPTSSWSKSAQEVKERIALIKRVAEEKKAQVSDSVLMSNDTDL